MLELKSNLQFDFSYGQFHFVIPIPCFVIPISIAVLEMGLKSILIPILELTPALLDNEAFDVYPFLLLVDGTELQNISL